ncbi:YwmB family TATA-box binding protein [Oceanobacillus sp. FSL K6-2867]|uniref:YwmB family TATA-box binding protein n=1 Tax=Oceanobacillus sp. FSL K6-2867 TaxID=2954748 RepID=UPI0030DAC234
MKKISFLLVLILLINAKPVVNGMESEEMIELANFTLSNGTPIENWQVTMKESITIKQAEKHLAEMKNGSFVTRSEDENTIKYLLREDKQYEEIQITHMVVIPKDKAIKAEIIAVIEGTKWNEQIEESYLSIKHEIMDKYLTETSKTFACLTTDFSGIIKSDVLIKEIKNYYNLQHIKTQFDTLENSTHKKIVYGYTDLWKESFIIDGTPMNLQLAVATNEKEELKYTIGTPILIHEY